SEQYSRLQRLVRLLNEHSHKQESKREQERQSALDDQVKSVEYDNGHTQHNQLVSKESVDEHPQHDQPFIAEAGTNKKIKPPSSQPVESSIVRLVPGASSEIDPPTNKDTVMEILQLVNEHSSQLEGDTVESAALTLWDFAGQYVFYTTHQTFLTRRAIYLLVIDLSQQVTDLVDDECYIDAKGIQLCKVHELVEIWLNSIHSCAPSSDSGIPPVILIGTHVDKIPEKYRQKVIDKYFMEIHQMLKGKPILLHLMDSFAIDNTQCDPKLDDIKRRIFELASQQTHWGEEKPARWLPLEQEIMAIKAYGVKVAPLSLVEEINRSSSIKIEDRDELEVFLTFQHDIGTILYFNAEGLREKVVLDPQWMIDAIKSLITDHRFIKRNPTVNKEWYAFNDHGKLTHELIDAIWTKKEKPDFHDNKEYLILVMEKLNIIARPMSYTMDGKSVKEQTGIEVKSRRGKGFKVDETREAHKKVPFTSRNTEKLHQTVLNRCRPNLMKYLNVEVVMMHIQQKGLFDAVTIRDIREQALTTDKISHLIAQIKKRGQDTYERFKECLFLSKQEDLKEMLDEEEKKCAAEMKSKRQGTG
ncbi:hypothetical protein ACJMK2_001254, partial [Sinanodonta woodiana]